MSESVGLAPVQKRDIILEVRVRTVRGFRKVARAALVVPKGTTFTMVSDEGAYLQGEDTAPPPLSYFTASVAF